MFNVHSAALQQMAHAAIARSISRPRGARTDRYRTAAVAVSSEPNAIAASPGQSASCAANSSGRRGPRCHSYSTKVESATRSPLSIVRRSAGAERRQPVNASIRTDVSSRINSTSMTPCVVPPAFERDEWLRVRYRLFWPGATGCARRGSGRRVTCVVVRRWPSSANHNRQISNGGGHGRASLRGLADVGGGTGIPRCNRTKIRGRSALVQLWV